ncbi:DNA-directed RNA polymerase subunit alpha C-terminal domain-containing protein [Paenibacillus sp. BR2-3]|uniref:DNA-directed RNA polymerase subunit alpha C-terminal domain-containing protein n=1 Tax=Paenibacillus sp. BR2-3 TaxID=3048494 RepID=UPI0039778681
MDNLNKQENDFPTGLSQPALRALANSGVTRLEQISKLSERELKQLHGLGPKAVKQLREALELQGLSFFDK